MLMSLSGVKFDLVISTSEGAVLVKLSPHKLIRLSGEPLSMTR